MRVGWTHFIGIGGVGMSALAQLLIDQGCRVSGSDLKENQFTRRLAAQGVSIYYGHDAANIAPEIQEVVISSAIKPTNSEVVAARWHNLPIIKRGELLARLFNASRGIALTGSHGKTTTSAMTALALMAGNLEPTAVVGGYVHEFASNVVSGKGNFFVAEADESDASFLWLKPEIALVTNIEADHLEHYGNLENIVAAFAAFMGNILPGGKAVLCAEDPRVSALAAHCSREIITYGFKGKPNYRADRVRLNGFGGRAAIYHRDNYLGELNLRVPGKYNTLNALGAIAIAHQLGVDFSDIAGALNSFRGVGRRFEVLWGQDNTWIVDDYAHHPAEIKAALAAASQIGARRVIAVFQPHRYSRTYHLYREFGQAFTQADVVIINDIYTAGEEPIPGVTSELIVNKIHANGHGQVHYLPTLAETTAYLKRFCTEGDLVITLGAGDVWKVGAGLAQGFKDKQLMPEMGL